MADLTRLPPFILLRSGFHVALSSYSLATSITNDYARGAVDVGCRSLLTFPFTYREPATFLQPRLIPGQGGKMLHRAAVADKALGLLMDRCRATFAKPEPDGSFTLYSATSRSEPMQYRVPPKMHKLAQKCIRTGAQRLRAEMNPIQVGAYPLTQRRS